MKLRLACLHLLLLPLLAHAQAPQPAAATGATPAAKKAATSDRKRQNLRGPVRSCTEEQVYAAFEANGRKFPERRSTLKSEFDRAGRLTMQSIVDGVNPAYVTLKTYDDAGRLLKVTTGVGGKPPDETIYTYDDAGRLLRITDDRRPDAPTVLHYDEHGRKTSVVTARAQDYRPNMSVDAGTMFEANAQSPNILGGGTATTIYDAQDQPVEVQVRDAKGELVDRVVRTYDKQGNITEEKQVLDDPLQMFPPALRNAMMQQALQHEQLNHPEVTEKDLNDELRKQLSKLMAGQQGTSGMTYEYDSQGRAIRTHRRVFTQEFATQTLYNQHGDIEREIQRSAPVAGTENAALARRWVPVFKRCAAVVYLLLRRVRVPIFARRYVRNMDVAQWRTNVGHHQSLHVEF